MSDPATEGSTVMMVGTATVNWNNDDLPGWRPFVPFPAILDEMAAAGYAGTEYSPAFGSDADQLLVDLSSRKLRLAGSYQWLHLRDHNQLEQEMVALQGTIELLLACDSSDLVVADAMSPHRIDLAGHVPADGSAGLTDDEWALLAGGLRLVYEQAVASGVRVHYHNHVGTYVETPAEVDRFLLETAGDDLDLCFDTGHYAYGGGDPTAFVLDHAAQIGYLHLKDVSASVLAEARAQGWSFLEALRHIIFCEFGDGIVDIPKVIDVLKANDYAGWVIVEQDTSARDSTESATASRAFLRRTSGI
jgi:inosose dehydratase